MFPVLNFPLTSTTDDEESRVVGAWDRRAKQRQTKLFGHVVHLGAVCGKILHSAQCVTAALRWETAHKNSRGQIQHPRPSQTFFYNRVFYA